MTENDNELLQERYEKHIKDLFKSFLVVLEDLKNDHEIHFKKLKKSLPLEYHNLVSQADYFDDEKMQYLRKKVLDSGNNSMRDQNEDLQKFTVHFKFKEYYK